MLAGWTGETCIGMVGQCYEGALKSIASPEFAEFGQNAPWTKRQGGCADMGKGGYLGGHTVIGPGQRSTFSDEGGWITRPIVKGAQPVTTEFRLPDSLPGRQAWRTLSINQRKRMQNHALKLAGLPKLPQGAAARSKLVARAIKMGVLGIDGQPTEKYLSTPDHEKLTDVEPTPQVGAALLAKRAKRSSAAPPEGGSNLTPQQKSARQAEAFAKAGLPPLPNKPDARSRALKQAVALGVLRPDGRPNPEYGADTGPTKGSKNK